MPGTEAVPLPPGTPDAAGPAAEEQSLRLVAIDAATYGIDPVVGRHVTRRMRMSAEEMGYVVLSRDETVQAAQQLRMPFPPAPADLWRVTWVARAQRGAFARVWAHEGRYVIEISVASLDGSGPFFARATSGAQDLHEVVASLIRQALPPPGVWNAEEARRLTERQRAGAAATPTTAPGLPPGVRPAPTAPGVPAPDPEATGEAELEGGPESPEDFDAEGREPPEREPPKPLRRWSLALQTEGAIGTSSDMFYNHLVGGRIDFRITRSIILGAYVGYANLRGRDGRVNNILAYGQIEDRVRLTSRTDITIPLRFGVGYLPFNGPVVRLAAGVNIPLGERVEVGFDLLTPTFWVLSDRTAVSFNLAAELVLRL